MSTLSLHQTRLSRSDVDIAKLRKTRQSRRGADNRPITTRSFRKFRLARDGRSWSASHEVWSGIETANVVIVADIFRVPNITPSRHHAMSESAVRDLAHDGLRFTPAGDCIHGYNSLSKRAIGCFLPCMHVQQGHVAWDAMRKRVVETAFVLGKRSHHAVSHCSKNRPPPRPPSRLNQNHAAISENDGTVPPLRDDSFVSCQSVYRRQPPCCRTNCHDTKFRDRSTSDVACDLFRT